jgi:pyruvyltransferase
MALTLKQWTELPNAGDVFSARVTAHLTGLQVEIAGEAPCRRPNLIGAGSILHWADKRSTVWGAGFADERGRPRQRPHRVLAVRGTWTARRLAQLGLPSPTALGDPGVFAPDVFPSSEPRSGLGIVPHYADREEPWVQRMAAAGVVVIDPLSPLETYMGQLGACERIASSSLHGLIFAHAYGIPAAWVKLSDRLAGGGFKFSDYLASAGLSPAPRLDGGCGLADIEACCELPSQPIDKEALREVLLSAIPV